MSLKPFDKLVKLTARAFYDDITLKSNNQPKNARSDNRGIAVVILDALTRCQWVREEDLARDLKLHSKQLRRILRFLEEEKLVTRDHRKETAKGAKVFSAAIAATGDRQRNGNEGKEKIKLHTHSGHSYCCLDYSQIYDVVRYRLHHLKKKLKDALDNRNTVQEYVCPDCGKRYTAFDALQLVSPFDEAFVCENCNGELVAESDKLAAEEMGDGDDNARRRREKLKDILQKMEDQLQPLMDQLNRVKDLPVPEFGTLQAWEARANAANRAANGDSSANEVVIWDTAVKKEDTKPDAPTVGLKVVPPWMIKQVMNLTKEQRGEVAKDESEMDRKSVLSDLSDDKKSKVNEKEDDTSIKEEYAKAYYAAFLKRQQEQLEFAKKHEEQTANLLSDMLSDRQVGMKSKREEDDEDDEVIWEHAPTTGTITEKYKLNGLNTPVEESGDGEDEIDWEEG